MATFTSILETKPTRIQKRVDELEEEGDSYAVYCRRGKKGDLEDRFSAFVEVNGAARQALFGVFDGEVVDEYLDLVEFALGGENGKLTDESYSHHGTTQHSHHEHHQYAVPICVRQGSSMHERHTYHMGLDFDHIKSDHYAYNNNTLSIGHSEAMRKAEGAGNDDCPVKIKLVAPPLAAARLLETGLRASRKGVWLFHQLKRAAVVQQSCKIMDLGIAQDDEAELARVLDEAIRGGADIILTSGGVSMGDRD